MADLPPYPLPDGITSRMIDTTPLGLKYHILESGPKDAPLIFLLHGYPEIAYSWRKVLPILAKAGFHGVAMDQRGYGRTTGWDASNSADFSVIDLVRDVLLVVNALGYRKVRSVVGHDFGAFSAALCALSRPDMFESLMLMSYPWGGTPGLPFNTANDLSARVKVHPYNDIHDKLAQLPEPRKHYKWYNMKDVNTDWTSPKSGIRDFLRGYFYTKSADWDGNSPHPLEGLNATELAKMPYYYIMPLHANIREAVHVIMKDEDPAKVAERSARWLPDNELDVYTREYERTSFGGGLIWYRLLTQASELKSLHIFAGKKIEIPTKYVSGVKDWGTYQEPGVVENMGNVCSDFRGVKLVEGAGHWVNSERPDETAKEILDLIGTLKTEATKAG